mmetsp:Transcript_51355/g.130623  ORF Transcript_51355/g.130623 Transcript_51355/m.130623 type:complete len:107 (-) Transcript_51355:200-520(-)
MLGEEATAAACSATPSADAGAPKLRRPSIARGSDLFKESRSADSRADSLSRNFKLSCSNIERRLLRSSEDGLVPVAVAEWAQPPEFPLPVIAAESGGRSDEGGNSC